MKDLIEDTSETMADTRTSLPTSRAEAGHGRDEPQATRAGLDETPAAIHDVGPIQASRQDGEAGDHREAETQSTPDLRFANPLIAEIVETWRLRQDMVRAQQKLTLQIKAILRRFTGGDKDAADKLYRHVVKPDYAWPEGDAARLACSALLTARAPLEAQRNAFEKHLTKLGKQLPIAHMADEIKGVGHLTLAKIVGEAGDLSQYRSVAAVWKRMGVAVIDGERQRKKSDVDLALIHGYSPERRSVLWNIADPLLKAQGKDENAGPYRREYDRVKAREMDEKGSTKALAHNRAMRKMSKDLLKDLTVEWRRVSRGDQRGNDHQQHNVAPHENLGQHVVEHQKQRAEDDARGHVPVEDQPGRAPGIAAE